MCFREGEAEEPLVTFRKRLRKAAFIGWAFGFGFFLASIYWVGYAFYVDAERHAILMPFAVAGLSAGLALFYAAASVLAAAMWQRGYARLLCLRLRLLLRRRRPRLPSDGLSMELVGEALAANTPHMQLAAYIGVYGLTLAALLFFPRRQR